MRVENPKQKSQRNRDFARELLYLILIYLVMKLSRWLFLVPVLVFSVPVFSQTGCPAVDGGNDTNITCGTCATLKATAFETGSTTNYNVSSIPYNPPYPYNSGTQIFIGIDDIWSPALALPFNFCYFGQTYNQIVVGTNGIITFDINEANQGCNWSYTASIPDPSLYSNAIYGAYHDIDPSVCGTIRYAVLGSEPCRTFVLNFDAVCHFSCNNLTTTQQIVLYETTNVIEVYIQDKPTCIGWNSGNAAIGLQDPTGTIGITPPGRNTGPWSTNNEAWQFTPSGAPNYVVTWLQNGNVISTEDTVVVCPIGSQTYTAQAVYTNCDGNVITVEDEVTVNAGGVDVNPTSNAPICENQTLDLMSDAGATTYTWTGPNGFTSNQQNVSIPNATPAASGYYYISTVDPNACTATDSIWVQVFAQPMAAFVFDNPVCLGDSIQMSDQSTILPPATIDQYNWTVTGPNGYSENGTGPSFVAPPGGLGTYLLTLNLVSDSGCTATHQASLTISPQPVADFSYTAQCFKITDFADQSSGGTPGYTYAWYLDGDSVADQNVPSFTWTFADSNQQQVTLVITDSLGCTADTTKPVDVKAGVENPVMPNILVIGGLVENGMLNFEDFAPGFNSCIDYKLYIYNRWGFKVFETSNDASFPDLTCATCFQLKSGTGSPLTEGTYYFVLVGEKDIELKGFIEVVRGS